MSTKSRIEKLEQLTDNSNKLPLRDTIITSEDCYEEDKARYVAPPGFNHEPFVIILSAPKDLPYGDFDQMDDDG